MQKELKKALDLLDEFSPYDIFVIPVRLDECQPADERLQNLHWVDLFPSYETGLSQILRVLAPDSSARQATHRQAAAQPSPTMETHSTTQRRNALEKECELLNEKIAHLRKAKIIETDAAVTFKLTKQLEDLEHQREQLEREIAGVVSKEPEPTTPDTIPPDTTPRTGLHVGDVGGDVTLHAEGDIVAGDKTVQNMPTRKKRTVMMVVIIAAVVVGLLVWTVFMMLPEAPLTLNGVVSDQHGNPLPEVDVKIEGFPAVARTDTWGEYTLTIEAEPHTNVVVIAIKQGFNPYRERVTLMKGTTKHPITMKAIP